MEPRRDPVPVNEVLLDAAVTDIDLRSSCEPRFDAARSTFEASRTFEEQYQGQRIHWSGTLQRAETFDYDLMFGSGPAVKAMIEVHRIPAKVLGESQVVCVLRLPADTLPTLEEAQGRRLELSCALLSSLGHDELRLQWSAAVSPARHGPSAATVCARPPNASRAPHATLRNSAISQRSFESIIARRAVGETPSACRPEARRSMMTANREPPAE